jgi:hypothetical protein
MQWCETAGGECVGFSARVDQIANDLALARRIPVGEQGLPTTAACRGSAPRLFLARGLAPRMISSRAISTS